MHERARAASVRRSECAREISGVCSALNLKSLRLSPRSMPLSAAPPGQNCPVPFRLMRRQCCWVPLLVLFSCHGVSGTDRSAAGITLMKGMQSSSVMGPINIPKAAAMMGPFDLAPLVMCNTASLWALRMEPAESQVEYVQWCRPTKCSVRILDAVKYSGSVAMSIVSPPHPPSNEVIPSSRVKRSKCSESERERERGRSRRRCQELQPLSPPSGPAGSGSLAARSGRGDRQLLLQELRVLAV
ncbi:hypothetical protein EYF80_055020 [Liparis tanakae]|uniref:Uncharacterized protein n=1 Tax=Liparis tanakae TaxID=230148 RepID=A0A4Z2F0T4_9TELE|nr:hypothetical protein EYF80_055020 [Liparis tanakae]